MTPVRNETTVSSQAAFLLNHRFLIAQAQAFATRVLNAAATDRERIEVAFGLALCGAAVPDPSGDALRGCLAGAAFPFSIGVAYLIIWRFAGRD